VATLFRGAPIDAIVDTIVALSLVLIVTDIGAMFGPGPPLAVPSIFAPLPTPPLP
jgi:hypothetical protein